MQLKSLSIHLLLLIGLHPTANFGFPTSDNRKILRHHSLTPPTSSRYASTSTKSSSPPPAGASPSSSSSSSPSSRQKRASKLVTWGKDKAGIQIGSGLKINDTANAGLGLFLTSLQPTKNGDDTLLVTVPADVTLSIEVPNGGPDEPSIFKSIVQDSREARKTVRNFPWFVQFSLYLWHLNNVSSVKTTQSLDLKPWLETLPQTLETPIHWRSQDRTDWLQYPHLVDAVERQEQSWKDLHRQLMECTTTPSMSWDDFVWGCEMARSRAFSGGYTGTPFNPLVYAFTLVLVTAYVGLNLGTLEQAANGAALVFCSSVLQDFVFPKFFRTKKYVICPVIDCANHNSKPGGTTAKVAYEYFGNAYSLSTTVPFSQAASDSEVEVFISYGSRSNDQLLQYYGFVEVDNPHDIYVMPPLREWDISKLEEAVGTPFAPGRLQKLDRAGLLGKSRGDVSSSSVVASSSSDDDGTDIATAEMDGEDGNPRGGVVISRSVGIDVAILQGLRALVSTDKEWEDAGESVGNFAAEVNPDNERKARLVARTAIEMELQSKATTLEEDRELLNRVSGGIQPEEQLALAFRIEKKKLLVEAMNRLR